LTVPPEARSATSEPIRPGTTIIVPPSGSTDRVPGAGLGSGPGGGLGRGALGGGALGGGALCAVVGVGDGLAVAGLAVGGGLVVVLPGAGLVVTGAGLVVVPPGGLVVGPGPAPAVAGVVLPAAGPGWDDVGDSALTAETRAG